MSGSKDFLKIMKENNFYFLIGKINNEKIDQDLGHLSKKELKKKTKELKKQYGVEVNIILDE